MIQTAPNHEVRSDDPRLDYSDELERGSARRAPAWLYPIRKAALARYAEMGFPTLRHEDWRFTNVSPIVQLPFRPVTELSLDGVDGQFLEDVTFAKLPGTRLVFVNGLFAAELSHVGKLPEGVRVGSLAAALATEPEQLEKRLGRFVRGDEHAFAALNTALFQDGGFVHVPAGKEIADPIQLLFVSTATERGATTHPRNLIHLERGARATVFETYVAANEAAYFTNAATELIAGDGAVVEHCKFQDESAEAFHISTVHATLGRSANVIYHSIATGARLSRNNIYTTLAGEGIECILNGLYVTKDDQLADHFMIVEHAQPHCASHEYFNGILDDRSKGVFHGRILVRPIAQKTDAKQTNKNLLLSDEATANTKPQLEIYADDVKCTHGATIGQLNDESIFYLRARGIGEETARRMLMHAFAGEIVDRIRNEAGRDELDKLIWDRLEQRPRIGEKK